MKAPIKWINKYIDIENTCQQDLIDRLIMSGSNVERVINSTDGVTLVVVGRITKITKHPDADRLRICMIDVGTAAQGEIQIVTAATNVQEGHIIPVAMVGSELAGGLKIKKGKLRGETSNGMLCSLEELGFSPKVIPHKAADGILIMGDEFADKIGEDALSAMDLYPDTIEFEITPNRPDCLNIIGLAREIAAQYQIPLKQDPSQPRTKSFDDFEKSVAVSIETPNCFRYIAREIVDVKVKPSPMWMQSKLMLAGVRPHSNIVDITNFVLLELGHPVHAFDKSTIDGKIIVRQAAEGEKITTLDEEERTLSSTDMVISDNSKALAIAGVMGGLDSGISDSTTNVLIEVAVFDKSVVRESSRKIGLRSEASNRYEKGVPAELSIAVMDRVVELVEILGVGTVLPTATDVRGERFDEVTAETKIEFDAKKITNLIGVDFNVREQLEKLGIKVDGNIAVPPYYRKDLNIPADLAEEAARMYGLDKLPATSYRHAGRGSMPFAAKLGDEVKNELTALGISEVVNYSFISPARVARLLGRDIEEIKQESVMIENPLGEDYSMMRSMLLPHMLGNISNNQRRKNIDINLFELGTVFSPQPNHEGMPTEKQQLVIAKLGQPESRFFEMKGVVEDLLINTGVCSLKTLEFRKITPNTGYMHPGRTAEIWIAERSKNPKETAPISEIKIGYMGDLNPAAAKAEEIEGAVSVAEIDFDKMVEIAANKGIKIYQPYSVQPAAERDAAFVVDEDIKVGDILRTAENSSGKILESAEIFDIYRSKEHLGEGKKSIAISLIYRADRTLTEEEVTKQFERMIKSVCDKHGAVHRAK